MRGVLYYVNMFVSYEKKTMYVYYIMRELGLFYLVIKTFCWRHNYGFVISSIVVGIDVKKINSLVFYGDVNILFWDRGVMVVKLFEVVVFGGDEKSSGSEWC